MTNVAIPDLAERRHALDPALSFIVQAPAGSGKTELLIQRFLRLLAHVDHPEEIVAITFTRKAAGEMRERVLGALAAARSGAAAATDHEKLTLELASVALRRDRQAGWCIAVHPARLRIQTVDSLCAALVRQMPALSTFGSQPDTMEDAAEIYLEAARSTLGLVESDDAVAGDVERLLAHLDNDVERVETLLAQMLRHRDQWLRHVFRNERKELEAVLVGARREALERVRGLLPASAPELIEIARYAAANLVAAGSASPIAACHNLAGLPGLDDADVTAWLGIAELLLTTREGGWRKRHAVNEGFPPGRTRAEKDAARRLKDRAQSLIATLGADEMLREALHELRSLPPPSYTEDQWEVLGAITRLLPRAVGELRLVFQARGKVDFTEVAQGALRALGEADAPTDLALALDYRIRHLLIDEFQDTSISQYDLVTKLTAGWERGDGRTLFAVGDPMQSIYRFREAEVGLFLRAWEAGIGTLRLEPIRLTANFRSQAGIVHWVNEAFTRIMPEAEDVAAGAVPYTVSVATRNALPGAAVSVHPFFNGDRAAEAAKVVQIISQARDREADDRIAVLVRNRGHLRDIVPRLKAAHLRFRAIEIEELGHRPVVQDLLALTRALMHPADRLAWLAVLRAPWCGLLLADLHALAGKGRERTLWESMNDDACIGVLSPDGRVRLQRTRAVLNSSLEGRWRSSLRERTAGAWYALGGPACVGSMTDLEDAEIYFDYLEEQEEAGELADPLGFEEGLAKLYALPDLEADEHLQIMTLHKAKGLEFDVVIVPGLGRSTRSDEQKLFLWMERPRRGVSNEAELLLAPIHETGADRDRIYTWIEGLDAVKEKFEDERLLYVAATRARRSLHLLGDARLVVNAESGVARPQPAKGSLLGTLWPVVEPVYAEAAARTAGSSPNSTKNDAPEIDQALRRLSAGWTLPAAPHHARWQPPPDVARMRDEIEFSWAGETARHVGSVVHRWLQRIADNELKGWDAARVVALRTAYGRQLTGLGVPAGELEAATGRVVTALTHAVTSDRGRWLLGPRLDACNERRVTAIINGERVDLVIDRMFHDADNRPWIVDYKTSSHEGADVEGFLDRERERYRSQLARYYAAAGRPDGCMLGLYFPVLPGWREWGAA